MTERKFTDEQIIKALECLAGNDGPCHGCIYQKTPFPTCRELVGRQALDLINRQRAEIERLQEKTVSKSKNNVNFKTGDYAKIANNVSAHRFKIGTIVKLERYDDDYKAFANDDCWWVVDDDLMKIDDLAKEMTEGKQCF